LKLKHLKKLKRKQVIIIFFLNCEVNYDNGITNILFIFLAMYNN